MSTNTWQDSDGKWHRIYGKMKVRRKQRQESAAAREAIFVERRATMAREIEEAKNKRSGKVPAKLTG